MRCNSSASAIVPGQPFPGRTPPCGWAEVADETIGLLETVARFHAVGVLHRDLKPSNVLMGPDGRPVVLDFGISWSTGYSHDAEGGGLLGTPAYLAPEQGRGDTCDARTDIYALGVIIYEAFSGRLPHTERTITRLLLAKTNDAPRRLVDIVRGVPRDVSDLVEAMLEPEPRNRPASVVEVLRALKDGRTTLTRGIAVTAAARAHSPLNAYKNPSWAVYGRRRRMVADRRGREEGSRLVGRRCEFLRD